MPGDPRIWQQALVEARQASASNRKRRLSAGKLLLLALIAWLSTALLLIAFAHENFGLRLIGTPGFSIATLFALLGAAVAFASLHRTQGRERSMGSVLAQLSLGVLGLVMTGIGALSALLSMVGFTRGRQLRRFGRVLLPPVQHGDTWLDLDLQLEDANAAPPGLGAQWRENGRTEHASVASFARLTLDLLALGAPAPLIAAANRDALDEIRHTELCFALARAIDGRSESPGPFPEAQQARSLARTPGLALAELAVHSLIDGALHEGVSARILAKLARRCERATIAEMLREIAADEGRHAAHGWEVVEWCLERGGQSVASALAGAVRVLPLEMRSQLPAAARAGAWQSWGIHSDELERAEYGAARRDLVLRVRRLIAANRERTSSADLALH